jgi:hypothetical protein
VNERPSTFGHRLAYILTVAGILQFVIATVIAVFGPGFSTTGSVVVMAVFLATVISQALVIRRLMKRHPHSASDKDRR